MGVFGFDCIFEIPWQSKPLLYLSEQGSYENISNALWNQYSNHVKNVWLSELIRCAVGQLFSSEKEKFAIWYDL